MPMGRDTREATSLDMRMFGTDDGKLLAEAMFAHFPPNPDPATIDALMGQTSEEIRAAVIRFRNAGLSEPLIETYVRACNTAIMAECKRYDREAARRKDRDLADD